jgi:predicted metal-dependent hydrolase
MKYDRAYINYLIYFHCERDYFECHEVLEEHWKSDPPKKRKKYWVGLIQIAVGLYHQRRGNFVGALRMISNAIQLLENDQQAVLNLGLQSDTLIIQLKKRKKEILDNLDYYSFNLPIIDKELIKYCQDRCLRSQESWGQPSDLSNEYLIHKHKNRNRSDVIEERKQQLELRKNARESK